MVNPLGYLLATTLAGTALATLALRNRSLGDWAPFIAYTIILSLLLPLVPRSLPPPPVSQLEPVSMGISIIALTLKLIYGIASSIPGGSVLNMLDFIADVLVSIINTAWALLAIYTVGYYAWLYLPIILGVSMIMAIHDAQTALLTAYIGVALSIIAGVLAPIISVIGALAVMSVSPPLGFALVTSTPSPALVVTSQGFGFTPFIIPLYSPSLGVDQAYWLWLKMNYTYYTISTGPVTLVSARLEPVLGSITCGNATCGAYYGVSGVDLGNGTVITLVSEPSRIWLWGSGFSVNTTLVRVGNESIMGCNATVKPSHWLEPVGLKATSDLAQLASLTGVNYTLPSPTPVGYRELAINVTPGSLVINGTVRRVACLVRLYGVVNNTWVGSTPLGYSPTLASYLEYAYAIYNAIAGESGVVDRLLASLFTLITVGSLGLIAWDYFVSWLRRLLG
ncbi:hypothetical protein [Vulcanisaeta souniana]|nr:hypothetical protein [Vulcanisaeta souniana]GGI86193.1 hypothetical protein GCM10007112_24010 [Vulcanisaeta souniana JCM 11219]